MPMISLELSGSREEIIAASDEFFIGLDMLLTGRSEKEAREAHKKDREWLAWRERDPQGWMKAHIEREHKKAGM